MDTKEFEKLSKAEQREQLTEIMINRINDFASLIRDFIAGARFNEGDEVAEELMQLFVSAFAEKLKESRRMSKRKMVTSMLSRMVNVENKEVSENE